MIVISPRRTSAGSLRAHFRAPRCTSPRLHSFSPLPTQSSLGNTDIFLLLGSSEGETLPWSSCTISLACRCGHERRHRSAGERLCRIYYVLAVICEGAVTLGVPKQTLPAVARGHFSRGRDSRSSSPSGNSRNVEDAPALTTCSPCTVLRFGFFSPRLSSRGLGTVSPDTASPRSQCSVGRRTGDSTRQL